MKKSIYLILFISSFLSCSDDNLKEIESEESSIKNKRSSLKIEDGRILFNSQQEVRDYHYLLSQEEKELENHLTAFGTDEFLPLYPQGDDGIIEAIYENILLNNNEIKIDLEKFDENIDFAEYVIPDDAFRALLNIKGEVQVGDEIFKYTDVGVFITQKNNYDDLIETLEKNNISNFLILPSKEESVKSFLKPMIELSEKYNINDSVSGFDRRINFPYNGSFDYILPFNPKNSSNQAQAFKATTGSPLETDPNYQKWFNSVADCSPRNTEYDKLINSLFGDKNICIDKYTNKRRVKVKAWNTDLVLVYSLGNKVKHQYKEWYGWKKEKTSEIVSIVEAVQYEYDQNLTAVHNHPSYNTFSNYKTYYSNQGWRYTYNNHNNLVSSEAITYGNLPDIFRDNLWGLEGYFTGWEYLDDLINDGVDSALEADKLNEYFWNGAWTIAKSSLDYVNTIFPVTSPNRVAVLKYPFTDKIIVQSSNFKTKYNNSEITRYYDYGGGIKLQFSTNDYKIKPSAATILNKPKKMRIKLIGVAKTSSHGYRGFKIATF